MPQFIHTSVSGAGAHHRRAPGWELERGPGRNDWESKAYAEALVKNAGFRFWTLIKPSFFMENFVRPSIMFEGGTGDRLLTTMARVAATPGGAPPGGGALRPARAYSWTAA